MSVKSPLQYQSLHAGIVGPYYMPTAALCGSSCCEGDWPRSYHVISRIWRNVPFVLYSSLLPANAAAVQPSSQRSLQRPIRTHKYGQKS